MIDKKIFLIISILFTFAVKAERLFSDSFEKAPYWENIPDYIWFPDDGGSAFRLNAATYCINCDNGTFQVEMMVTDNPYTIPAAHHSREAKPLQEGFVLYYSRGKWLALPADNYPALERPIPNLFIKYDITNNTVDSMPMTKTDWLDLLSQKGLEWKNFNDIDKNIFNPSYYCFDNVNNVNSQTGEVTLCVDADPTSIFYDSTRVGIPFKFTFTDSKGNRYPSEIFFVGIEDEG